MLAAPVDSTSSIHPLVTALPSLSSSMWLMRRAMVAFSSLARSLALTASATISCHSSTWLWVSSALPDSLACHQREQQWVRFHTKHSETFKRDLDPWPERQPSWWTAPGLLAVSSAAPRTPPASPPAFLEETIKHTMLSVSSELLTTQLI